MKFTELISCFTDYSEATFDVHSDPAPYSVFRFTIELQGIPAEWDQEQIEEALINETGRIPVGCICGGVVLGKYICSIGGNPQEYADAIDGKLLTAVSQFIGADKPYLPETDLVYICDFSLLEDVDKNNVWQLISELPDRLYAHLHICPDVIVLSPNALPRPNEFELFKEAGYTELDETGWYYK